MDKNSRFRSFIAIELPVEIKKKLKVFVESLKKEIPGNDIKWVNTDNIHLTIKFLGETNRVTVQKIADKFEHYTNKITSPVLKLSKIGMFPNKKNPKIIWAGCSRPDELIMIHTVLDKICTSLDFSVEKRTFSPHLTIGRVRQSASLETIQNIQSNFTMYDSVQFGSFSVKQIIIFHSDLKPTGPIYTPILKLNLSQ